MTARERLLDAGVEHVRARGLAGTSVDDLCTAAGVTKGAFFHHFDSKEAYAVALAEHWSTTTGAMFAAAAYHDFDDPLDRVLAYLDLRAALASGTPAEYSCVVGTMVQESFLTHPVRDACGDCIGGHASTLVADFAAAITRSGRNDLDPRSLAVLTQTVIQGSFVTSKALDDPTVVHDSIAHLQRYLTLLLRPSATKETT